MDLASNLQNELLNMIKIFTKNEPKEPEKVIEPEGNNFKKEFQELYDQAKAEIEKIKDMDSLEYVKKYYLERYEKLLKIEAEAEEAKNNPEIDKDKFRKKLVKIYKQYEEFNMLYETAKIQNRFPIENSKAFELAKQYKYITSHSELEEALKPFWNSKEIAIDTENVWINSKAPDYFQDKNRLIQLAIPDQAPVLIDMFSIKETELLKKLLAEPSLKIYQNAKYDISMLQQAGFKLGGNIFDCMIAGKLLEMGLKKHHDLKSLVKQYLYIDLPKEMQKSDWNRPELTREQLEYSARDVTILLELYPYLAWELKTQKLIEPAKMEFAVIPVVVEMELTGIYCDKERMSLLLNELEIKKNEITEKLDKHFSETNNDLFGYRGSAHILTFFYSKVFPPVIEPVSRLQAFLQTLYLQGS